MGPILRPNFIFWQPWMVGYNGELTMGGGYFHALPLPSLARLRPQGGDDRDEISTPGGGPPKAPTHLAHPRPPLAEETALRTYIIRRLLLLIPTLFIVSSLVFLFIRLIPGDIIDVMANEMGPESGYSGVSLDRAAIERRLGLDVPIHVQYGRWIGQILQGNLGTMLRGDQPVVEEILPRLPVTLRAWGVCRSHRTADLVAYRHLLGDSAG